MEWPWFYQSLAHSFLLCGVWRAPKIADNYIGIHFANGSTTIAAFLGNNNFKGVSMTVLILVLNSVAVSELSTVTFFGRQLAARSSKQRFRTLPRAPPKRLVCCLLKLPTLRIHCSPCCVRIGSCLPVVIQSSGSMYRCGIKAVELVVVHLGYNLMKKAEIFGLFLLHPMLLMYQF